MTGTGRSGPASAADLAGQLRAAADRVTAGWSTTGPVGALAGLAAMPATVSAQPLETLLEDIGARRAEIQALKAQLEAFDGQLGALENSLRPMVEWARTWADLQHASVDPWGPAAGGST